MPKAKKKTIINYSFILVNHDLPDFIIIVHKEIHDLARQITASAFYVKNKKNEKTFILTL